MAVPADRDAPTITIRPRAESVEVTKAQLLLLKRLRFVAAALLTFAVCTLPVFLPGMLRDSNWFAIGFNALSISGQAYLVHYLFSSNNQSIRALRVVEAILFSIVALGFLGYLASPICLGAISEYYDSHGVSGLVALAMTIAFPGMAMMVLYGVFIPNTRYRCIFWVSALGVLPVIMSIGFAARALSFWPAVLFVIATAAFLGLGAAISLYGAFRIERLRSQVAAGRRLGSYRIKQQLGEGGMGQVFAAEHHLLKRPCAIKVMSSQLLDNASAVARFEREVEATVSLNHPNIVQIYDYGLSDDGDFYYAMEQLNGLTLDKIVKNNEPLAAGRTIYVLRQVCDALIEAHQRGIVHRDLKPGNIMLCRIGSRADVVKLLDFGLVRFNETDDDKPALTMTQSILGSPEYMSPEQVQGGIQVDHRADLYSFGATAYFLVSGRPPFVRDTPMETMMAHYREAPPDITEVAERIDADLAEIIMSCLSKDPDDRMQSAVEIRDALNACDCGTQWQESDAQAWWQTKR